LALRLALQRDTPRGSGRVLAPVGLAQVRQQLELRILADLVLGALDLDPGLVELDEQPLDGDLQDFCKFRDRYFRHYLSSAVLACCSPSNQCARAAMISFAARSASRFSMPSRSSTACSARSSRVTIPRLASTYARPRSIPGTPSRASAGSAWSMTASLPIAGVSGASR